MGAKIIVFDAIDVLLTLLTTGGRMPRALPASRMARPPQADRPSLR